MNYLIKINTILMIIFPINQFKMNIDQNWPKILTEIDSCKEATFFILDSLAALLLFFLIFQ